MDNKKIKAITQPIYYILLSLKEERRGYEIMKYVDWLINSRVKVGPLTSDPHILYITHPIMYNIWGSGVKLFLHLIKTST